MTMARRILRLLLLTRLRSNDPSWLVPLPDRSRRQRLIPEDRVIRGYGRLRVRLGGSHLTARNRSSAATGPDLRRPDLDDDLDLGLDQVS